MNYFAVFPGQGSQSMGMLADLNQHYPIVKQVFAGASRALEFDLWQLIQTGPENKLNLTENTQPALLVAGVACYEVWKQRDGGEPSLMAGHSLGEYTALVCSGAFKLSDACQIVALRGRLMQEAVPEGQGCMAAIIGIEDSKVAELCQQIAEQNQLTVSLANYNSPLQVVISGHTQAVRSVCELAEGKGAKLCKILPVSVPSHSALMASVAEELKTALSNTAIATPQIPVIHNVDVAMHQHPDDIREALVKQLTEPVKWVDTIKCAINEGLNTTIEFGPGRVLLGLNKRIDRQARHYAIYDEETLTKAYQHLV